MATETAPIIHYEVYVRERTQWMLQVRFRADQKEEAINEAKLIEKTLGLGVKVVRETYDPETNTCEEVTAYVSQKLTSQEASFSPLATSNTVRPRHAPRRGDGSGGGSGRRGGGGGGSGAESAGRTTSRQRDGESLAGLFVRLIAIIILSVGVAMVSTAAASSLLGKLVVLGVQIDPTLFPKILFATFASVFLLVAVPLALIFIGGLEFRRQRSRRITRPAQGKVVSRRRVPDAYGDSLADMDEELTESTLVVVRSERRPRRGLLVTLMDRVSGWFEPQPKKTPQDDLHLFGLPVDNDPEATVIADVPPADMTIEAGPIVWDDPLPPPEPEATVFDESPIEAVQPIQPDGPAVGLERHRMTTMRFLGDLLAKLKTIRPSLDAYNRFGVDLIMAGAVETLAGHNTIPERLSRHLLQECVELLGTKKPMAESFCDKVEEYLHEPRYMLMVQAGREMMERFQRDEADVFGGLAGALDQWNKPTAKPTQQQIVTVLFTDMVGSTDMTQARGDMAAQEVVRRHNSIVRNALAEYDGREVKHTGDGIMASFASTANAVDAAIVIQRAVTAHNQTAPDIPVHLRIGINAGEPIQEEDDLFGTTVQLAARICAKADTDQILCSNVVRELSQGKGRRFASLGEHALKGFRDSIALYEVIWLEISLDSDPDATQIRAG